MKKSSRIYISISKNAIFVLTKKQNGKVIYFRDATPDLNQNKKQSLNIVIIDGDRHCPCMFVYVVCRASINYLIFYNNYYTYV